jgi:hypothetical protein
MASQSGYEVEIGYFISLHSLRALLASISTPPRRWWVDRVLRASIVVGYSNPVYTDMPNTLMYEFPVLERNPLTKDESWVLILLHPVAASQRAYGLYFEGDDIKQDLMADWDLQGISGTSIQEIAGLELPALGLPAGGKP